MYTKIKVISYKLLIQYPFPNTAQDFASFPHCTQCPFAGFCSKGMQRHVAPSALSFISVSHSLCPQNNAFAIFLLFTAFAKSLKLCASITLFFKYSFAFLRRLFCISSKTCSTFFSKSLIFIVCFSLVSLLTNTSCSLATSFGPISNLNGTPLRIEIGPKDVASEQLV